MKNIFINNYRRTSTNLITTDDTDNQYYINNHSQRTTNLGERKMILQDIQRAVSSLSKNLRTPFLMAFQGYKYEEIAEHMRVPLGTVKIRIHNARKRLKVLLKDYDPARREPQERQRAEFEASLAKLQPLMKRIAATDELIDQIVYRLYGLTEEETRIVEWKMS